MGRAVIEALGGMSSASTKFASDGFAIFPEVIAASECDAVADKISRQGKELTQFRRLLEQSWCLALAQTVRNHPAVQACIAESHVPLHCIYFDKSPGRNWLVPWHQDLSVPDVEGLTDEACLARSVKDGVPYVQPPAELLEKMVSVRIHIDDSDAENGPLRVIAGSHRSGRLTAAQVQALRLRSAPSECVVPRGGVIIMRPLLLHASSKAREAMPRRVLQYLFASPQNNERASPRHAA